MQPVLLDCLNLAALFQTGIDIIYGVDECLVTSYHLNLADRDFDFIKDEFLMLHAKLLELPFQRLLTPYEIFIVLVAES